MPPILRLSRGASEEDRRVCPLQRAPSRTRARRMRDIARRTETRRRWAKGAARSRTQVTLLRPTGEPCQRFTASGVPRWYPAEGNRCDVVPRRQDRSLSRYHFACNTVRLAATRDRFDKIAKGCRSWRLSFCTRRGGKMHVRRLVSAREKYIERNRIN